MWLVAERKYFMIKLAALLHTGGQHVAAWRHPAGVPDAGFNLAHYRNMARIAESAKFDFIFTADSLGLRDWPLDVVARCAHQTFQFEPLTLMASLSAVTKRIGFVITASTTFNNPYTIARQFASLNMMTGGRAAWNIVTSSQNNEAANFGMPMLAEHDDRYARAEEFVEVVKGLWNTMEPGGVLCDRERGLLFDPEKIKPLHHHGKHYTVDGVLNVPRSPYGDPLLVQAGASESGRKLASTIADIIFAGTATKERAISYYADIKQRIAAAGRNPEQTFIMPGLMPIIADSEEKAHEQLGELDAMISEEVSLTILSDVLRIDVSSLSLDGPLPDLSSDSNGSRSLRENLKQLSGSKQMTVRQLAAWYAAGMGHLRVAGTPEQIADLMQDWVETGACDGFLVSPPVAPGGLELFAREVVPILQKRGIFRREYEGSSLRENLGLPLR
jgi:N-acetyl-S-(2-succino)cysteine monooxygenase